MLSFNYSGVVQLVARQPLELVILVRVQAPEPIFPDFANQLELLRLKILGLAIDAELPRSCYQRYVSVLRRRLPFHRATADSDGGLSSVIKLENRERSPKAAS